MVDVEDFLDLYNQVYRLEALIIFERALVTTE